MPGRRFERRRRHRDIPRGDADDGRRTIVIETGDDGAPARDSAPPADEEFASRDEALRAREAARRAVGAATSRSPSPATRAPRAPTRLGRASPRRSARRHGEHARSTPQAGGPERRRRRRATRRGSSAAASRAGAPSRSAGARGVPGTPARRRPPRTVQRAARSAARPRRGVGVRARDPADPHRDRHRERLDSVRQRHLARERPGWRRPLRIRSCRAPRGDLHLHTRKEALTTVRPSASPDPPGGRHAQDPDQPLPHPRRAHRARRLAPRAQERARPPPASSRTSSACSPALPPRCAATRASAASCGTARSSWPTLERIALAVAEHYRSVPGLTIHTRTARQAGVGIDEVARAREWDSQRPARGRAAALSEGARATSAAARRSTSTRRRKEAGWSDEQLLEAIAVLSLECFTAMVNVAGEIPVDGSVEETRVLRAA